MKRSVLNSLIACILFLLLTAGAAYGHCEVPCGIYDDQLRASLVAEHISTIAKAMKEIKAIESKSGINYNQLVRWINAKEYHADQIQDIVSQYFLTQRIKPQDAKYQEKLSSLHSMLVLAMKCKQSTDTANTDALEKALSEFKKLYFS